MSTREYSWLANLWLIYKVFSRFSLTRHNLLSIMILILSELTPWTLRLTIVINFRREITKLAAVQQSFKASGYEKPIHHTPTSLQMLGIKSLGIPCTDGTSSGCQSTGRETLFDSVACILFCEHALTIHIPRHPNHYLQGEAGGRIELKLQYSRLQYCH